ncbi:hypothetical protein [uncultured Dialister sp.]|uniref:hypothetical protein n=1 Tax=uncultured Dialister sp. TaxID=278064 RepID=UPI0025D1F173|nr:hypothetical protein [uncultured Dialister sp.]
MFRAYGYNCFAIFDGDADPVQNSKVFIGLISKGDWKVGAAEYEILDDFGYFGKDFEEYFRSTIENYKDLEAKTSAVYKIASKPGKAKAIAMKCLNPPPFIKDLKGQLECMEVIS